MNKAPTFLLVGTAANYNKGCEAIVEGTMRILKRRFGESRFIISSYGELDRKARIEAAGMIDRRPAASGIQRFESAWWIYKVLLRPFPELALQHTYRVQTSAARESDCTLEVGGDNYSLDYGIPTHFISLDRTLLKSGKPLFLWGASVGPFDKNAEVEALMQEHLAKFSLIFARESETVNYLRSIGITENVKLVADPAFALQPVKPQMSGELAEFIERFPIGLNLSPLMKLYTDSATWTDKAKECIRKLVETNIAPVLLIPHVFYPTQNDYEFLAKAAEDLTDLKDRLAIVPPSLSAAEYKWIISRTRAFAGSRTHSTIAAFSSCVPTISIGYSLKSTGLNEDIYGHTDWRIKVADLTPDLLAEKFEEIIAKESDVRNQLDSVIPDTIERAYSAGDYLAEFLNRSDR